ncbi:MAG: DUF58 domain-containing protein [Verrucomicrobia bacterium]|nr:DUF58 domain-containing protein [Verrucomicrobiota bacterium]
MIQTRARGWIERLRGEILERGNPKVVTEVMQDANPQRYLDPAVLAQFTLTPLLARLIVEGFISGLHKSPFHGFSVEFADHREYVPGDDLKYLDWQVYARTDRYYIKRYEEETNLRCYLVLDRSASMSFGTMRITKWDYACFLVTCLAYLMIKQQDAAGLALFGAKPGFLVPPRCRTSHLRQIMQVLIRNPPSGKTDVSSSLRAIITNLKRRGLVVVVSDLIDEPEQTLKSIRLIGSHGHDVIVFHIQDAAEIEFPFDGPTLFRDMETGEELEIDPASARAAYVQNLEDLCAFYRKGLVEVGIDYQMINTRDPYDKALSAYLGRRAKIRG